MWQLVTGNAKPRFFRPDERAIVFVVVSTIAFLMIWNFDTRVGVERVHWLDFVFGTVASGFTGLASALPPLSRVLVGLLVVSPLDQAPDVLLGRPDAWGPQGLALELVTSTIFTWILPYLDPPAFIQRWFFNARSRSVAILRKSSIYVAYGGWLFVVYFVIAFVALSMTILAGYEDTSVDEETQLIRLGNAAFIAVATVLILSVWLLVRFLRRGKTAKAFTDPPAFVQRWVANAQSRWGAILRKGVVYVGYVVSLSVAFVATISVLAGAKDIITILAGHAPESEGWTVVDRIGLAALIISIIGLGTLLVLARNTSRGELRRRLRRSFIWSLAIMASYSGSTAALVICTSYGLLNNPDPSEIASLAELLALLAQSPSLFAIDILSGVAVFGVLLAPYVYGVVWLGDNAQAKGRGSILASIIIAAVVILNIVTWLFVLGGAFGFLIAGPDGRDNGIMAGGTIGVVVGLGLTWLINRRWTTPRGHKPVREMMPLPDFVADAVSDSAGKLL